jgi:PKD repeat protein
MTFVIPYSAGTAIPIYVGTADCMGLYVGQVVLYTGSQTAFTADFSICNDSIPPPSTCENYITPAAIQGLTVALHGGMMNGQTASYYWNFGDGFNAIGQDVTHTYNQQGVYNVVLQTVTPDSCVDYSNYTLVLMDSINPPSPCENYISVIGLQGLYVSFEGNLLYGQQASFSWNFGDGSTGTGQFVDHTYGQLGIYDVVLQTITNDSCLFSSTFQLILMDSIPNGCAGYFVATPTGNPHEMNFQGFTQSNYPAVFTWQFGDGTTATGQNLAYTYCCYGTFIVMLTSTDSTGCSSTYAAPVLVYPDSTYGNLMLNGQVKAGNNWLTQGVVTLFGSDQGGSYYAVQTVYIDSAGFYNFSNVSEGTYYILAYPQPDSLSGGQYLPTFYGDVVFWEQATPVYLGLPANPYNITLVSFDSIGGGDGIINGQITGGGKSMLTGGQEVLLLDSYGTPVRITYTDAMGYFSFGSLPFGDYKVNPVITGLTTQPALVILDATNPSANVIMTINGNTITGVSEAKQAGILAGLYPNPAVNEISVTVKSNGAIKIQIIDASGKIVFVHNETVSASGTLITIPLSGLTTGLYSLIVQDGKGNVSSKRFIKN